MADIFQAKKWMLEGKTCKHKMVIHRYYNGIFQYALIGIIKRDWCLWEQIFATDLFSDDWEIYKPEPKGHDWVWALDRLSARKKVRRNEWDDHVFIFSGDSGCIKSSNTQGDAYFYIEYFKAKDWVLYEE